MGNGSTQKTWEKVKEHWQSEREKYILEEPYHPDLLRPKLRKTSILSIKNKGKSQKSRGFDFGHCVKPQNNNKSTESPDDKEWGDN